MVAYWTPKNDTAISDWEDGAAYNAASGWFAVTDGASTGSNSREWAYTLAHSFVQDADHGVFERQGFTKWLDTVRAGFDPSSGEYPISNVPQWVRQTGEYQGAFATLVGGQLDGDRLDAIAVGDCCLFHLPAGHATGAGPTPFPLADPRQFGTSPMLVPSVSSGDQNLLGSVAHLSIRIHPGDVVFVASDALSETLMRRLDQPLIWQLLARIGHRGFTDLCRDLRTAQQMKNDDVTLFRALVPPPGGAW